MMKMLMNFKPLLVLAAIAMLFVCAGCPADESADSGDAEPAAVTAEDTGADTDSETAAASDEAEQMADAGDLSPREAFAAEVGNGAG